MPAAAPPRPQTTETFKPQPADERQLVCPNPDCARPDQLVLMERVTASTPAEFYDVGVTYPEIDRAEEQEQVTPHGGREVYGVRCQACSWSKVDGAASLAALRAADVTGAGPAGRR